MSNRNGITKIVHLILAIYLIYFHIRLQTHNSVHFEDAVQKHYGNAYKAKDKYE